MLLPSYLSLFLHIIMPCICAMLCSVLVRPGGILTKSGPHYRVVDASFPPPSSSSPCAEEEEEGRAEDEQALYEGIKAFV